MAMATFKCEFPRRQAMLSIVELRREQWDRFEAAWAKANEWGYSDSDIEHSYYWLGD